MKPLVSIIMTSYNAEKYIAKAIESVICQTYQNWELLIADDCSIDGTRLVISKYIDHRIKIFHNEKNIHYLRTRNKLLTYVTGDLIALLDSDDLYEPDKLEKQVSAFTDDPSLGLCGSLVSFVSDKGQQLNTIDRKPLTYEEIKIAIKNSHVFTGSCIMVRTCVVRELGGYRDFFNSLGYEDYDLSARIVERYKSIILPEALYKYRQYPGSTSRKDIVYNPFKLHGYLLVQHLIKEREQFGNDSLERNDIPAIINFIVEKNKPYIDDPSLIYRQSMWSHLHKKLYKQAYWYCFKGLKLRPLLWANIKTTMLLVLISLRIIKE